MTEESDKLTEWSWACSDLAWEYSYACKKLRETNPNEFPAIRSIAIDLISELWDRGFSVSEINSAFSYALSDLPRYAAGEDRRGDKGGP
jgi:hypothetical protein